MRKILHVGADHAAAASRRHVLRTAGFDVIATPEADDPEQLGREHDVDLIVLEPRGNTRQAEATAGALAPGRIPVLDLGLDSDVLTAASHAGELALAVCALLRLNATEQALRESDARFRSVADAAPVLIWSSGADRMRDYF